MSEMWIKILMFFAISSGFGWVLLLIGFSTRRSIRRRNDIERCRTAGTVSGYKTAETVSSRGGKRTVYRMTVDFTADGRAMSLEYENSMDREKFPPGTPVEVLYDMDDPTHFHLEEDPVFQTEGGRAVQIGAIWILAAAALTLALAVLVGGADPKELVRDLVRPRFAVTDSARRTEQAGGGSFTYQTGSDRRVTITGYSGRDTKLTIPAILDGYIVTGLAGTDFGRAVWLTELTVSGTIGSIPMASFIGCSGLTKLTLREGIRSIGSKAFGLCTALREVTLPESLTSIAKDAFPEDCAAVFHVKSGSAAETYCREMGFETADDESKS